MKKGYRYHEDKEGPNKIKFKDNAKNECILEITPIMKGKDRCILLGIDEPEVFDEDTLEEYEMPKNVVIASKMYLSQTTVEELLPILQYFAITGELPLK